MSFKHSWIRGSDYITPIFLLCFFHGCWPHFPLLWRGFLHVVG